MYANATHPLTVSKTAASEYCASVRFGQLKAWLHRSHRRARRLRHRRSARSQGRRKSGRLERSRAALRLARALALDRAARENLVGQRHRKPEKVRRVWSCRVRHSGWLERSLSTAPAPRARTSSVSPTASRKSPTRLELSRAALRLARALALDRAFALAIEHVGLARLSGRQRCCTNA